MRITESWQENPTTGFCERERHCWIRKQWLLSWYSGQDIDRVSEIRRYGQTVIKEQSLRAYLIEIEYRGGCRVAESREMAGEG